MDAERWAISVVGQGVRGGVATGKMPSFERDQATCHVRITATARLSQRAAKDPERLHGNAAPMFYCGWSVMPLTVASECSQSQLVPREIGRKQGFLGCSFSLGEVPAAPASRLSIPGNYGIKLLIFRNYWCRTDQRRVFACAKSPAERPDLASLHTCRRGPMVWWRNRYGESLIFDNI